MNHTEFTSALIRLSRHQIGIGEACTLFSIGDGSSKFEIAEKVGLDPNTVKSSAGACRRKGYCRTVYDEQGNAKYFLTEDGKQIIRETLDIQPDEI